MRFDAEAAVRYGLALEVADDPLRRLGHWPPDRPPHPRRRHRHQGLDARTANPGVVDTEQHRIAVDTELGPQATSITSPEFARRLAGRPAQVSYRSSSASSGDSMSWRRSQRNPATAAPSTTRWSNAHVSHIVGRATTSSSTTTGRGLSEPIPRIAASG